MRIPGTLLLLLLTFTANAAQIAYPRLGVNVEGLHKLTSSMPFTDIFKVSRGWFTSCEYDWLADKPVDPGCTRQNAFNTGEQDKLNLDKNGWVRSLPRREDEPVFTSVVSGIHLERDFPLGRYVLLYAGKGKIQVSGALNIISEKQGRIEFDLFATQRGIKIKITEVDSRKYIRNIHLVSIAHEKHFRKQPFDPQYLEKLRPFEVIRFMPWNNPRHNRLEQWKQRPASDYAHYTTDKGVPVESMLALVKAIDASPWLNIPYQADDDFIRRYARLVRKKFKGRRKVFVEYANEVWNTIFPAHRYAYEQALQHWPHAYAGEDAYQRRVKLASNWYAKRSVEVCRIWKQVFGRHKQRVVCVISAQANVDWVGREVLDCPLWIDRPCGLEMDAYAVNAYFGDYIGKREYRETLLQWAEQGEEGMDKLFAEIMQGGQLPGAPAGGALQAFLDTHLKTSMQHADDYGLPLLAYEGGQHLIRYDPPHQMDEPKLLAFLLRANADPRMETVYQRYLQAWEEHGGKTLVHFYGIGKPEPRDFFAMLPSSRADTSPKYRALLEYLHRRYQDQYTHSAPLSLKMLQARRLKARLQSRKNSTPENL